MIESLFMKLLGDLNSNI